MSRSSGHGPDYDAVMACARLLWDGLKPTVQAALLGAHEPLTGGVRLHRRLHYMTAKKASDLGLSEPTLPGDSLGTCRRWLTPMGLLVREAGLAARAEAER